jgi:HK97 family phage prohead protease
MQAILDTCIEIKSFNSETGEFEGYASTYGNVDKGNDICVKGCFDETLSVKSFPALCWQHEIKEVVGEWLEMKSDAKGLLVKGRVWINKGIARAEQAWLMLTGNGPRGLSIGFVAKAATRAKSGVRMITKALLKEISVVTYPMNTEAQIISTKSEEFDALADAKYDSNAYGTPLHSSASALNAAQQAPDASKRKTTKADRLTDIAVTSGITADHAAAAAAHSEAAQAHSADGNGAATSHHLTAMSQHLSAAAPRKNDTVTLETKQAITKSIVKTHLLVNISALNYRQ